MNKAILFNGPLLSGKDIAVDYLIDLGYPLVRRETKDHLHELTQKLFCISAERYWDIYNNRELKEQPLPEFTVTYEAFEKLRKVIDIDSRPVTPTLMGSNWDYNRYELSVREAVIYVSEVVCKPTFGNDYFGKARADSIKDGEIIADGSCGFPEELDPLIDKIGNDNILLMRIHRKGYDFASNDSRNYMPDEVINNTVDIYNYEGGISEYLGIVELTVQEFLDGGLNEVVGKD